MYHDLYDSTADVDPAYYLTVETRNDPARAAALIRRLGWLLVVLGLFLAFGMGILIVTLGPGMLYQNQGFNGTHEQGVIFLTLFVLVFLFGINAIIGGVWMIRTGRRNLWVMGFMIGLVVLIFGVTWPIVSH
jgi:hypothetical protein